jgi:uncharacterized protein
VDAAEDAVDAVADRFGIGWRHELSAGILANLDTIDVIEVLADDYVDGPRRRLDSMRALAAARPVQLHGVSLGLASTEPIDERRLVRFARLVERIAPESWSEHLAFVRGGTIEIGHLAAPPRCAKTIEGTCRNLSLARAVVGTLPFVENVATLVEPPGSALDEAAWIAEIVGACRARLLLDLHNLHANAVNFQFSAAEFLERIPVASVATVHLAGGRWIGRESRRILDDHRHDVPDPVFELDGDYPRFERLLGELDRAREAVRRGRAAATASDREVA